MKPPPGADELVVRRVLRVPRTELVLTHRRLPPDKVEAHREGWSDIVAKLDGVLARTDRLPP